MYYDMDTIINKLYSESKSKEKFNNLMDYVSKDKNILYAMKRISMNPGRNTAGVDGIIFDDIKFNANKDEIKKVKMRLYMDIKSEGRTKKIPKANGKTRTLGIVNLHDRIAQQCVLNILEPILEPQFSQFSYGFRKGRSTKHCVASICNCLKSVGNGHVYDCDLEKFFDTVQIDIVLDFLRKNHKIEDPELLKVIKYLMTPIIDGEKITLGLPQGSVLGPILANVMMHDFELEIEKLNGFSHTAINGWNRYYNARRSLNRRGKEGMFKSQKEIRGVRMFRYADDFVLISNNPYDIYDGIMMLEDWCAKYGLKINKDKSKLIDTSRNFGLDFLGYKLNFRSSDKEIGCIDKRSIIISPKNSAKSWKEARSKIRTLQYTPNRDQIMNILMVILGYYNYFDICTNPIEFTSNLNRWLYKNHKRLGLTKFDGENKYKYEDLIVCPTDIRASTTSSFKNYSNNHIWNPLIRGDTSAIVKYQYETIDMVMGCKSDGLMNYNLYIPGLIKRDKGDPVTSLPYGFLDPLDLEVHHIKPLAIGGKTEFRNLVIVHKEVHQLIHGKIQVKDCSDLIRRNVNQKNLDKYIKFTKEQK